MPVSQIKSDSINVRVVIDLLEGFLISFGIKNVSEIIEMIEVELKHVHTIKFHFSNATRDYVNILSLATELHKYAVTENNPIYLKGQIYYLVTATVRTNSISIIIENEKSEVIDLNLQSKLSIKLLRNVFVTDSNRGELTFTGERSPVFAVELHQLNYYPDKRTFRIDAVRKFIGLRGGEPFITSGNLHLLEILNKEIYSYQFLILKRDNIR